MEQRTQNRLRIAAIVWLTVIGLNALAAGYSFIVEPSGKDIGIPLSYLRHSPFNNYRIPGILLFTTIGLFCMVTAYVGLKKHSLFPYALLAQGCILLGWIVIQMLLVRDVNALHVICGMSAWAWMIAGFLLRRANRKAFNFQKPAKGF